MSIVAAERDRGTVAAPVWDSIARSLDIESLAACCCVCRDWNMVLSNGENFWKEACEFSDMKPEVFPRDCGNWREYALLLLKRLRQMRRSECFKESGFTIDRTEEHGVRAIYYYKKRLAVALRNKIEMWNTSPESFLFEIHCGKSPLRITSVKFDDLYIMVADSSSRIRSFDVSSREVKSSYEQKQAFLLSYDFESATNIVVGSAVNMCYIWKLSSGRLLKKIDTGREYLNTKVKLVLVRKPEPLQREGGVIYLFAMGRGILLKWTITYHSSRSKDSIECSEAPFRLDLYASGQPSGNFNPKCSLLSCGRYLYFPESSDPHRCQAIREWDLNSYSTRKLCQGRKIGYLLAVGAKYIAFQTAEERGVSAKVHVVEISSNKTMATYEVPHDLDDCSINAESDALVFCGRDWLDGLDLRTDGGVLLAYRKKDRKVYFVNWTPRHEFAC